MDMGVAGKEVEDPLPVDGQGGGGPSEQPLGRPLLQGRCMVAQAGRRIAKQRRCGPWDRTFCALVLGSVSACTVSIPSCVQATWARSRSGRARPATLSPRLQMRHARHHGLAAWRPTLPASALAVRQLSPVSMTTPMSLRAAESDTVEWAAQ
jgi:hypothetical protein